MSEIALTATLSGSPYGGLARVNPHLAAGNDIQRAQHSGIEYTGHTRCRANSDTCQGHRAKGTEFCIGHLRAAEKAATEGVTDEQG